jgi:hypothetical protein
LLLALLDAGLLKLGAFSFVSLLAILLTSIVVLCKLPLLLLPLRLHFRSDLFLGYLKPLNRLLVGTHLSIDLLPVLSQFLLMLKIPVGDRFSHFYLYLDDAPLVLGLLLRDLGLHFLAGSRLVQIETPVYHVPLDVERGARPPTCDVLHNLLG